MNYLELFDNVKADLPGNTKLLSKRAVAMQKFIDDGGYPTTKQEDWKYTSLYSLANEQYQIATALTEHATVKPLSAWYIYLDGSQRMQLPAGVKFLSLADYLKQHPIADDMLVGSATYQLNTSLMAMGYIITVQAGVAIDEPIHLLIAATANQMMYNLRNSITIANGARVSFIEQYLGEPGANYCHNIVTNITVGDSASCEVIALQQESKAAYHLQELVVKQHDNSNFCWRQLSMGSKLARTFIEVDLFTGASCELTGQTLITKQQHIDHNTLINHRGNDSDSSEVFNGLYNQSSRGVFKGEITVQPGVQNIVSNQLSKNILLANTATVNVQPRLAIYNNEVQCSHGATIGQLTDDALFYLQSRGIVAAEARNMLLTGFMQAWLNKLQFSPVQDYIKQQIQEYLTADV